MRRLLLLGVLLAIAGSSTAQPAKEVEINDPPAEWAICTTTDDVQTLKGCVETFIADQQKYLRWLASCARDSRYKFCVDALLEVYGVEGRPAESRKPEPLEPAGTPVKPTWQVTQREPKTDGTPTVTMYLRADEDVAGSYGNRIRFTLIVRCFENTTAAYVDTELFLGSENASVMYQLDKERPVSTAWQLSSDSKATGLWGGATSIPFLKSLFGRQSMLFRVRPYRDTQREVTFSIAGLDKEIEPLRKACKW